MKRVFVASIAALSLLPACKKENQLTSSGQTELEQKNKDIQRQAILAKMQSTRGIGSFLKMTETSSTDKRKTGCQAIPTTVGQQIVVTDVLLKTVTIDFYSFYQFYADGLLIPNTMKLQVAWMDGQKRFSSTYSFSINSTSEADALGLALIPNIEVPKDKVVTFTISQKHKCGQNPVYEATYIYSTVEAQSSSIIQIHRLMEKTSVVNSLEVKSEISEE